MRSVRVATFACWILAIVCPWSAEAAEYQELDVTAALTDASVRFAFVETRFSLPDHWLASVGVAYLDPGGAADEGQLRVSAIGSWSFEGWRVDNRHLISISSTSVERYRSRVRVVRTGVRGIPMLSLRAYDEAFVDLERSRAFRNNLAAGLGFQISKTVSAELYRVWEMNRAAHDDAFVLALVTMSFGAQR